jgi:hypothetical protein
MDSIRLDLEFGDFGEIGTQQANLYGLRSERRCADMNLGMGGELAHLPNALRPNSCFFVKL